MSEREKFEQAAAELYGGSLGELLDRNPHAPEEYAAVDLNAAWRIWQIARESISAENERLKQQNKDAFADYKKQWDRAEAAESQLSAMREQAKLLVAKMKAVHADSKYLSVWTQFVVHGGVYSGLSYAAEFNALAQALEGDETL